MINQSKRCTLYVFGRVVVQNKGQPRKKIIDAREHVEKRCDSSRLEDNMQQLIGISIPEIVSVRSICDGIERATRVIIVSERRKGQSVL